MDLVEIQIHIIIICVLVVVLWKKCHRELSRWHFFVDVLLYLVLLFCWWMMTMMIVMQKNQVFSRRWSALEWKDNRRSLCVRQLQATRGATQSACSSHLCRVNWLFYSWTSLNINVCLLICVCVEVPACRLRRSPFAVWLACQDVKVWNVKSTQFDRCSETWLLPQAAAGDTRPQQCYKPWQVVQSEPIG